MAVRPGKWRISKYLLVKLFKHSLSMGHTLLHRSLVTGFLTPEPTPLSAIKPIPTETGLFRSYGTEGSMDRQSRTVEKSTSVVTRGPGKNIEREGLPDREHS